MRRDLVTIRVVGLGPADVDLLTVKSAELLRNCAPGRGFLRTRRHPAASIGEHLSSFDDLYEAADRFDDVYTGIVAHLIRAAEQGEVLYAVPGSPMVAEHTVELLFADPRVEVIIEPALSFVDLSWTRLGIDPVQHSVRIVDGHQFETESDLSVSALLVAQCHSQQVLSDIKLSIDTSGFDEIPIVTVLHHLGLPTERLAVVSWDDLDRLASTVGIEADHLTSLYIPKLRCAAGSAIRKLEVQMRELRLRCPWDAEQTHDSLARYVVEEAYELVDAISYLDAETTPSNEDPIDAFESELGDVLFQVIFHACLAAEQGWFSLSDVAETLYQKLERRHPHVFGDVVVADAGDVKRNWESIKRGERTVVDDPFSAVPDALPSLLWASKILKFVDQTHRQAGTFAQLLVNKGDEIDEHWIGDVLLDVVALARKAGIDPEISLRRRARRLRDEIRALSANNGVEPNASK